VIERQHELLAQGETHRATLLRTVQQQAMQLRYLQESAAEAQARRGLRALRLLRRGARAPSHATRAVGLRRVLVDLVPLLPGGENGGAKVATLALLRCLARRTLDQVDWVLLTSERAHDELRGLQAPNVRLVSVQSEAPASPKRWPHPVRRLVNTFDTRVRRPARPRSFDADLLFCPFTAPLHFDPTVPTVCVVYDLQYLEYPEFFTAEERQVRDRTFRDACQLATRLVCISDFVRNSVLQRGGVPPESVVTIHLCNTRTSAIVSDECASPTLRELGVRAGRYLLYPANPWPHKNHRMLLTAFGMYRAWNPRSDLKLVCTGAAVEGDRDIRADAERMGLGDHVVVAGYLSDQQLEAVMERAKALVFPSLYEGFGMPVLEAMDCGVPVLCSNLTSLPEVAGDAALLFDPRKPSEIADAIARIETEPELVADLIARGATQAARFGRIEDVASRYLALFESTVGEARQFPDALHGVHPDGWAGQRVLVTYGPSMQARELELVLLSPEWSPLGQLQLSMRLSNDGQRGAGSRPMQRGKPVTLRQAIPRESGFIELTFDRAFQPARLGMNEDTRELTCLVQGCTLRSATEMIDLLRG
jgi:glycosyltransferase involved in cell wall biosynthesis